MRAARTVRRTAALLAAVGTLAGCYEWSVPPTDMPAALRAVPPGHNLRIVRTDHQQEHLTGVRVVGDTLFAFEVGRARDGNVRKIPVDSVAQIRETRVDGPAVVKTLGVVVVSGAILFVAGFAFALAGMRD